MAKGKRVTKQAAKAVPPPSPARPVVPAPPPGALPPIIPPTSTIGPSFVPHRQAAEYEPPVIPPNPDTAVMTLGMPLRYNRASSLFIDDPLFQELRGQRADKTMQRLLSDPVIAGTVERTGLYLRAPDWNVTPGGPAPIDKAWSDYVNDNLQNLATGWRSTVANMADAIAWGFSLHETLYEMDGDQIMWADFSPREQRTVRSWYVDEGTGRLHSLVQVTDRGLSVPIPAWKLLHFRTHPASGRPEGRSLVRNAFLPWSDKQEVRRLVKLGIRRDFTGLPMMEVPAKMLSAAATPQEKAALAQAESMVRDIERDEREGIIVPASKQPDGSDSGWKFSLVASAGRRQFDFDALFAMLNRDMLIAMLSEYILLGHETVGSFALADVKANLFGKAITSWLDMVSELMVKKALPILQAFNPQFAGAAQPIFAHGDIDEIGLGELGTFIQAVGAGGYITPGPEIEKALRSRAKLPQLSAEQEI